jgi:hypothetical protein
MTLENSQFRCPHCTGVFQVPAAAGPQTVACPLCSKLVTVVLEPSRAAKAAKVLPGNLDRSEPLVRTRPDSDSRTRRLTQIAVALLLLLLLAGLGYYFGLPAFLGLAKNNGQQAADPNGPPDAAPPIADGWADARTKSLRTSAFEVKILRVERGPVLGRDVNGAAMTLDDEGIMVYLRVRNISDATRNYSSWYAASASEDADVHAELTDNLGNVYPLQYFAGASRLRGHTPEAELVPSQRIEDVLVFDIPASVQIPTVSHFLLKLDGNLLGSGQPFQFAIPRAMLRAGGGPNAGPRLAVDEAVVTDDVPADASR